MPAESLLEYSSRMLIYPMDPFLKHNPLLFL